MEDWKFAVGENDSLMAKRADAFGLLPVPTHDFDAAFNQQAQILALALDGRLARLVHTLLLDFPGKKRRDFSFVRRRRRCAAPATRRCRSPFWCRQAQCKIHRVCEIHPYGVGCRPILQSVHRSVVIWCGRQDYRGCAGEPVLLVLSCCWTSRKTASARLKCENGPAARPHSRRRTRSKFQVVCCWCIHIGFQAFINYRHKNCLLKICAIWSRCWCRACVFNLFGDAGAGGL
jgi:hypothetical protein